jgi:phospholipid/cholesterol/gamma-HCH transport system substrate-binding protein
MKATSGQKVKIGIFTVAGIAILLLAIFFIGNQKSLFNSTFNVHGIFKNVSGLQVGNNVRFAGINVGVVEAINIVTDSTVRVDLTLNTSVKKFVKKDAKMSIGSDGLMGDKLIVISPGGPDSRQVVENGDKLATVNPLDVDRLINRFTTVADNAASITGDLAGIVRQVNQGKGTIGRLLYSDKMAKDLEGTVSQAKNTMKSVSKTTDVLHEDLKAAQNNFLLRGFFKKKEKAKQKRIDSLKKVNEERIKKLKKQKEEEIKAAEKNRKS